MIGRVGAALLGGWRRTYLVDHIPPLASSQSKQVQRHLHIPELATVCVSGNATLSMSSLKSPPSSNSRYNFAFEAVTLQSNFTWTLPHATQLCSLKRIGTGKPHCQVHWGVIIEGWEESSAEELMRLNTYVPPSKLKFEPRMNDQGWLKLTA